MIFFYEKFSILDTVLMLAFLVAMAVLVIRKPVILVIAILLVNVGLSVVSFYAIDLGGYITELKTLSFRSNLFVLQLAYCAVFMAALAAPVWRLSDGRSAALSGENLQVDLKSAAVETITCLLTLVVIAEYLSMIWSGVAILENINKVDYSLKNPIVSIFGSTATYIAVFFGGMYYHTRKARYAIVFAFHFLFLILAAQKFSALIVNLSFFFAPFLATLPRLYLSRRNVLILAAAMLLFISAFYVAYSQQNAFSQEMGISVFAAIGYRALYLSAHAQWSVFLMHFVDNVPLIGFEQLLRFNEYIVEILHPLDTSSSLEKGVTFGMVFPAYYTLGVPLFLHLPLLILQGGLIGLCLRAFVTFLVQGYVIGACILSVILNVLVRVFIVGDIGFLFSAQNLVVYVTFLLYLLISRAPSLRGGVVAVNN